ncbi:MAG: acyl-CoA dehydrogenase family protein [Fodinibius sp.]|nr:acyl-CoA dehydrogenase family protein [Fodinibius sp.]MDZ7657675.1 acyl-CoA dehydrogenase family protein [Fodinibius sp.]
MASNSFNIDDPFQFESELSEDDRMIMETARDYAQSKLEPRALKGNQEEYFDKDIATEMGDLGLLGSYLPPEYGGVDASQTAYGLIAREVERVDSGYRSFMSVQSSLVMFPIFKFGTDEQKERFLPKLATGELDRLLWTYRTRSRFRSGIHVHNSSQNRWRMDLKWSQNVDYQLSHC